MPHDVAIEFLDAGLDFVVAVAALFVTALVGRHLTEKWEFHQKRREQNLESVREFHHLFGEFKEVLKIWRVEKDEKNPFHVPPTERLDLLKRACAVEGKAEALAIRLATERCLQASQLARIGMFRQAIQSLRQSIRDDVISPLGDRGVEYDLMNELAPEVSAIVTANLPRGEPDEKTTKRQLAAIVAVRSDDWKEEIAAREKRARLGTQSEPSWTAPRG